MFVTTQLLRNSDTHVWALFSSLNTLPGSGLRVADKRSLVSHIIKKSEGSTENCNAYCKSPKGKFSIAHDCTRWCHCDHGVGHIKDCADCHQGDDCPNGKLFFDENLGYCEWPNKVARADCGAVPTTTPEPTTTTPKPTTTTPKPTTTAEPTIGPTANPDDCKERCPPACADWAAKGHCTHEWVNGECPMACQHPECVSPDPTPSPNPNPGTCSHLCTEHRGKYAVPGKCTQWCHCDHGIGYLKDCAACHVGPNCPAGKLHFDPSLGRCEWPDVAKRMDCGSFATRSVAKRSDDSCLDKHADCKFWAANGDCKCGFETFPLSAECKSNCGTCDWQRDVVRMCPGSCDPNCDNPVPPGPCEDDTADCKFWAANGDCVPHENCGTCDWQKDVARMCRKSCNTC